MPSINRQVLALAIPAIVSNITVPLLGLCDTTISGHLGAPEYLAAISAGTMMINIIYWLFGFLRMGTTGLSAEAFGKKEIIRQQDVLIRSFTLSIAIGFLVVLLHPLLKTIFLDIIAPPEDVESLAGLYFTISIFAAPATLATMAVNGWMIGMQNTVRPMIVAILTNIINIAFSLCAVYVLHKGFAGIAFGTLCANWIGLLIALICAKLTLPSRKMDFRILRNGSKEELKKFFSVNTDLFFRSACVMGVSLAVTSIGSRLGTDIMAANAVIMQFFIFFSYFMDGFAFAGEALTGKFRGASDFSSLRKSIRALLLWSAFMAVCFSSIYLLFGKDIAALLTDQTSVQAIVNSLILPIILLPLISAGAFIFDGFFIGLLATRQMLYTTLASASVFFIISFLHLHEGEIEISLPDNSTLWYAFLSYLFLRGAILSIQLRVCLVLNRINNYR